MAHVRVTLAALAVTITTIGGSAVVAQPPGKGPNLPQRTGQYLEVAAFKSAGGVTKADAAKAKAAFEAFAKYHADYVSLHATHTAPQDFRVEPPMTSPSTPLTVDQLISELYRNLLVPSPLPVLNPVPGQAAIGTASARDGEMIAKESEYIRGMGAALDKALGDIIRQSKEQVVKINATRMLAAACRSGAQDHWPTVTKLLTDPGIEPEIRYYALQAAGNLLAAYDITDYRSRRHAADPKTVGALIAAVQNAVLKADAILPLTDVQDEKGVVHKVVPPEQVPVVKFIRRQAIRSLGQVRFADFEAEKGKTLYPAHTLALAALNKLPIASFQINKDKIEYGPATKKENDTSDAADAGEAVLGILNMAPPKTGAAAKQYAAPMADVIATGVINWVGPRSAVPADKSLPWKGMAIKLDEGLKTWQGLYDVNWNPVQPAIQAGLVPQPAKDVAAAVTSNILDPLGTTTRPVNVTGLQTYQRDVLRKTKDITPRPFLAPDSPALPLQLQ